MVEGRTIVQNNDGGVEDIGLGFVWDGGADSRVQAVSCMTRLDRLLGAWQLCEPGPKGKQ